MKTKFELKDKCKSKVNKVANDAVYEIIKLNKTTCWVRLWQDDEPTEIIYKNVKYSYLKKL